MAQAKVRTEDEIIAKSPIILRFGDIDFKVPPLPLNPAREWRSLLIETMKPILDTLNAGTADDSILLGLKAALYQFPEKLLDLVLAYGKGTLDREVLMETATDEQVNVAFQRITSVAFPFLAQLGLITDAVKVAAGQMPASFSK